MTISKDLEQTIQAAFDEARRRRHEFVTLEHVLWALLKDAVAAKILKACGANLAKLRKDLETFFEEQLPQLPEGTEREPQQTAGFWRSLQRAAMHVQGSGKTDIDGGNLLVAMYRERESHAVFLLEQHGVRRLDVLNYIAHGITKGGADEPSRTEHVGGGDEEAASGDAAADPLEAY